MPRAWRSRFGLGEGERDAESLDTSTMSAASRSIRQQRAAMGTDELRHHFHVGGMFQSGRIRLTYSHYDRLVIGGAMPRREAACPGGHQADRNEELPRPP